MNLDRYEKLDGFDHALRLMREGKTVAALALDPDKNQCLQDYKFDKEGVLIVYYAGKFNHSKLSFNRLNDRTWYIKKPFDVRQAMLDRPNEWVGAFLRNDGEWMLIGFDTQVFEATSTPFANLKLDVKPQDDYACQMLSAIYIDKCIPIEDVPEEAKR